MGGKGEEIEMRMVGGWVVGWVVGWLYRCMHRQIGRPPITSLNQSIIMKTITIIFFF